MPAKLDHGVMQLALENPNSIGSWYLITENCDASLKIHPGLVIGHDDAHQFSLEPAHQVLTLDICASGNLHIRALNADHRLQSSNAAMAESIVVEPGTPVQLDFFGHQILFDTDLVYVEDRVVLELDLVNIHPPQGPQLEQKAEPDSTPPEQVAEHEPPALEQEAEPDTSRIEHDPAAHMLALDLDREPKFVVLEQDSQDSEAGSDMPAAAELPQVHQVIDVTQEPQPNSAFSAPEPGQEPGSGSTRLVWAAAISVLVIVMLLVTYRHSEAPPTTTDTPSMDTLPTRQTAIGPPAESAAATSAKQPAAERLFEPVDQVLPADTDAVIDTPSASLALAATPADENLPKARPGMESDNGQATDEPAAITPLQMPAATPDTPGTDAADAVEANQDSEALDTRPAIVNTPPETPVQDAADPEGMADQPAQNEAAADAASAVEPRADDDVEEEPPPPSQTDTASEVAVIDRSTPLTPPADDKPPQATAPAEPLSSDSEGASPATEPGEIDLALSELTVVSKTPPAFPKIGVRTTLSVDAEFVVDTRGNVRDLEVKGDPPRRFKRSVIEAVETWRFEPYLQEGTPRQVRTFVRITFRN